MDGLDSSVVKFLIVSQLYFDVSPVCIFIGWCCTSWS